MTFHTSFHFLNVVASVYDLACGEASDMLEQRGFMERIIFSEVEPSNPLDSPPTGRVYTPSQQTRHTVLPTMRRCFSLRKRKEQK